MSFHFSGIHIQQPVLAASAIVFPSMDGKRVLNGFTSGSSNGDVVGGSIGVGATGTAALIDTSQGVLQFRTLLPSTSNKVVASQCRPSLVMQSTATTPTAIAPSVGAEIASAPTFTCLGTFMATSTVGGVVGPAQQVFLYSLAPNAQLSIAPTATATILPAVAPAPTVGQTPQQPFITTPLQCQARLTVPSTAIHSCHWAECRKSFCSSDRLFSHVYTAHFIPVRGHREIVSSASPFLAFITFYDSNILF